MQKSLITSHIRKSNLNIFSHINHWAKEAAISQVFLFKRYYHAEKNSSKSETGGVSAKSVGME